MARDYTVIRVGTDSSSRGIFMSRWMWRCWQALLDDPRLAGFAHLITIVQGPWMEKNGGGAQDSAGYHDRGGCIDIRTWNLTAAQITLFILVASEYGFQFWRRDARHNMDPHAHCVFGSDRALTAGASQQVADLLANPRRNGLASGGPDYEKRYTPIRLAPLPGLLKKDYLMTSAAEKKLDAVLEKVDTLTNRLGNLTDAEKRRYQDDRERQTKRYQNLVAKIGGLADQLEGDARAAVLRVLAEEPDVTGADNPAKEA